MTTRNLDMLIKRGVLPAGDKGRAPLLGCTTAYIKHLHRNRAQGSDLTQASAKLKDMQTERAKLDLQEKRGDLARVSVQQRALNAIARKVGQVLDGIARIAAPRVVGLTDVSAVEAAIDAIVAEARAALADLRVRFQD